MSQSGVEQGMNDTEQNVNTSASANQGRSPSPFQTQFISYCEDLTGTFPEFANEIAAAKTMLVGELMKFFNNSFATLRSQEDSEPNTVHRPRYILPNIPMSDALWNSLSSSTRGAIMEYMRVLGMCAFFEGAESSEAAQEHWQNFMSDAVNNMDFSKITGFFKDFIGKFGDTSRPGGDISGNSEQGGSQGQDSGFGGFPKLPEKFLRGHLAKLAEELVRDIRPEDLGLTPELLREIEESPSRAFDLLIQVFTRNPQSLQNTFQRIGKKLQQKVASGQIKPQEIAREAEELMKEFAENSEFVEIMENLKSVFGMEDMGLAKKAGQESSARLAAVKERLNKKKEAKAAAATATVTSAPAAAADAAAIAHNQVAMPSIDDLVAQIESASSSAAKKKSKSRQK